MKNNDRAFVEAVFDSKTKKEIDEIVNKNISQDMFYNSPVVEHIRGNMSHVLHCTIYHGLSPEAIQNENSSPPR